MKANDFKKKQRPRFNIPTSMEHDLILLSRLLSQRMRFPFHSYPDDEESEDGDDYDGDVMMDFGTFLIFTVVGMSLCIH